MAPLCPALIAWIALGLDVLWAGTVCSHGLPLVLFVLATVLLQSYICNLSPDSSAPNKPKSRQGGKAKEHRKEGTVHGKQA